MKKESIYKAIYRAFYTIELYGLLVMFLHTYIGMGDVKPYHFITGVLVAVICTLFFTVGTKWKLIMGISLGAGIGVLLFVISPVKVLNIAIISGFFLGLVCFLVEWMLEQIPFLRYISMILIAAALVLAMVGKNEIHHMAVVLAIFYLIICYVEIMRKYKHRQEKDQEEYENRKIAYLVWLLPVLLVYFIALSFTPAPDEPYRWPVVKKVYTAVVETASEVYYRFVKNEESFQVGFTGVDETAGVGGSLKDDEQVVMEIKTDGRQLTNLYLTGRTFDSFDGREWKKTDHSSAQGVYMDTLHTVEAAKVSESKLKADYLRESTLYIKMHYMKTKFLFAPSKTYRIRGTEPVHKGGDLQFDKLKGYGEEYQVYYLQMNLKDELFNEMILNAYEKENVSDWNLSVKQYMTGAEYGITFTEMKEEEELIRKLYGIKPELSEDTLAYFNEVTKDCNSSLEKLYAIEEELSSYEYTKTPGNIPKDVDTDGEFLDYLITNKKGYCTYYATAFVLLARNEGFPARFVEGYAVPVVNREEIKVKKNMAHAWPEIYVDGVGWIPFEPTPGYGRSRYKRWKTGEYIAAVANDADFTKVNKQETEENPEEIPEEKHNYLGLIISVVAAVAFMGILATIIERLVVKLSYRKKTLEEKYNFEIKRYFILLEGLDCNRKDNETLREFRMKLNRAEIPAGDGIMNYEKVLYQNGSLNNEMVSGLIKEENVFMSLLKERKPMRYILMQIRFYFTLYREKIEIKED